VLQQLMSQQAALVAAAAQGSTFVSPVAAALSSPPHVTVGSLTAVANGALPQPAAAAAAAAAGNGITTTAAAAGQSTHISRFRPLHSAVFAKNSCFLPSAISKYSVS